MLDVYDGRAVRAYIIRQYASDGVMICKLIYWMEDNFIIEDHAAIVLATDIDDENRKHMKFVVYPTGEYEEVDELAFNDIRS